MFKIEMLGILHELSNNIDEYQLKQIENKAVDLIKQHKEEYLDFKQNYVNTQNVADFFKKCENIIENNTEIINNPEENSNDFAFIQNQYLTWLKFYNQNSKSDNNDSNLVIERMLSSYLPNRIGVIKNLLSMNDDNDFEAFKWNIKNNLRKYYAIMIKEYMKSERYKKMGFFEKRRKKKEISYLIDSIGSYDFDIAKIKNVLD